MIDVESYKDFHQRMFNCTKDLKTGYINTDFVPILWREIADKHLSAEGVANAFIFALVKFSRDKSSMFDSILMEKTPEFIDAVIDDKKIAEEAKEIFNKIAESHIK